MGVSDYFYGKIPKEMLVLDSAEVSARLQTRGEYKSIAVDNCKIRLLQVIEAKYCGIITDIQYLPDGTLDLGFAAFKSESLKAVLRGAGQCFVFAVTLGINTDRIIAKANITSPGEAFILDALASAYAEAACNAAEEIIKNGRECYMRFSPGYGDLPLAIQPQLLSAVNAGKLLNITVDDGLLMTPCKSITAILGIA